MRILSTIESRLYKKGQLNEITVNGANYILPPYQKGVNVVECQPKECNKINVIIPNLEIIALRDNEINELKKAIDNNLDYIRIKRGSLFYKVMYDDNGKLYAVVEATNETFIIR